MAKNLYPSLDSTNSTLDSTNSTNSTNSIMLCANVEWKDGKINIGKKFGIDGISVTDFHLRFGLKMS